jgi:hypothetical protein
MPLSRRAAESGRASVSSDGLTARLIMLFQASFQSTRAAERRGELVTNMRAATYRQWLCASASLSPCY